jgi:hypothetical protein
MPYAIIKIDIPLRSSDQASAKGNRSFMLLF